MQGRYNKFFIASFLSAVFLIPVETYAQTGWVLEQVGNAFFSSIVGWVLSLIGGVLAFIMELFDWMLQASMGFYDAPVVDAGWGIMRDFANMFFIVALIIMAFATIFEVSGYDFRSMITRFLIAAVFINFSLALCRLYLQVTDAVSHVFLTAIGDASGQIGQGLSLASTLPDPSILGNLSSIGSGLVTATLTGIFGVIFLGGLTLTMGTAFAFIFVRIPILWYLMIFAPIAIIMSVFPTTKKNFDTWYNMMLGWGMFLPIFLFFLYFGVYFLSRQGELVATIKAGAEIPGGVPFQTVFSFVLVWIFVIGGLKTAYKMSMFASTHIVDWSNKPGAWVGKRTGWTGAWQSRKKQWQEEGVRIPFTNRSIGGEQKLRAREARIAGWMGVRGMQTKEQRLFLDKVKTESDAIQERIDAGQLTDQQIAEGARGSASNPTVYAYRRVQAQRGQLTAATYENTLSELGNNQLAAQDFAKAAKESKFSNLQDPEILASAANVNLPVSARREMYSYISSEPRLASQLSINQLNQGLTLSGGATSRAGKDLLDTIGKNRPDRMVEYRLGAGLTGGELADRLAETRALPKYRGLTDIQIRERIYREAITSDAKTVAGFNRDVWNNTEYQAAIKGYVARLPDTPRNHRRQNYVNRLVEEFAGDPRFGAIKQASLRNALTIGPAIPGVTPPP